MHAGAALQQAAHLIVLFIAAAERLTLGDQDAHRQSRPINRSQHHRFCALHVEREEIKMAHAESIQQSAQRAAGDTLLAGVACCAPLRI